jgi:hypothetical protein
MGTGDKRLAVSVLRQAFLDMGDRKYSSDYYPKGCRENAIAWVSSVDETFRFWCSILDIDAKVLSKTMLMALEDEEVKRSLFRALTLPHFL